MKAAFTRQSLFSMAAADDRTGAMMPRAMALKMTFVMMAEEDGLVGEVASILHEC